MTPIEQLKYQIPIIEEKLGYHFQQHDNLMLSMIHRSFTNENKTLIMTHNERLEFLGDSILNLIISEFLYLKFPLLPEGELSSLRSRLVECHPCCSYATKLNLEGFLLLGKGEKKQGNRGRESILADFFEALIGAIYLDGGLNAAREFFFGHFTQEVETILKDPTKNWKADLQDYSQKKYQEAPIYETLEESGPDHAKTFRVAVMIHNQKLGEGRGCSKKEAQQLAAKEALHFLNSQEDH